MKKISYQLLCLLVTSLFTLSAFAWDHSIELGYGYSHDPNNVKYNNSGFLLTGDIYTLYQNAWTYLSLNGGLGQWHSTAPQNQNLTTVALAVALRFYPLSVAQNYPPYLLGSAGPAYLSSRKFGTNTQGSNFTIQSNAGLGVEVQHFDVNLRFAHYSNAHLSSPNEGFNILYLLSIGYLF